MPLDNEVKDKGESLMRKPTKQIILHRLVSMTIAAIVLWSASAYVIYFEARPLVSLDKGRTLVFDPIALIYATLIIVAIAVMSWVPIYIFARQRKLIWRLALTSISTWALLSLLLLLIENASGRMYEQLISYRAFRVLGLDNVFVFMPVVIPIISVLSGAVFAVTVGLQNRRLPREAMSPKE
jgi:hypothetical protein